jgi:putative DNA primase/helicase
MGIAEGVESALALHLLHAVPVWSAFCALNLEQVRLPPYVRRVLVAVDLDASETGERAAEALAKRLRSWRRSPEVILVRPSGNAPQDLNDELLAHATVRLLRKDGSP